MIELKLQPYCYNCGAFVPETSRQELFAGGEPVEHLIYIYCENADKCTDLYNYIQKSVVNKVSNSRKIHTS